MSDQIERHVLGAMLFDETSADDCLSILQASDFQSMDNRDIFTAFKKLRGEGKTADAVSVASICHEDYVSQLIGEVVTAANVHAHAKTIIERSRRRALQRVLTEQLAKVPGEMSLDELQVETENRIMAVREWRDGGRGPKSINEVLIDAAKSWGEIADGTRHAGVTFGLQAIDSILMGAQPGKYTVIGARPGVGKSALALQMIRQSGVPSFIHSLEMLNEEQVERVMAQQVDGLDSYTFRSAEQLRKNQERIKLALIDLKGLPIFMSDDSTATIGTLAAECRTLKRKHGIKLVVVDYLQLVSTERRNSRTVEIGEVSKGLKRMANDLKIHVVALASLSRECEKRDDKRPIKADLRESGDIEHDADSILMLYRESDYNKEARDNQQVSSMTEFLWRKNRGGAIGDRLAVFDGKRMRFVDPVHSAASYYREFMKGETNAQFLP